MNKKLITILLVLLLLEGIVSGGDLSQFRYINNKEARKAISEKYGKKAMGKKGKNAFIRDEIKKIKSMKLSDGELLQLVYGDEFLRGTRVAALRIWIKRNYSKKILPKLYEMSGYFVEKWRENVNSPYYDLYDHTNRFILEIKMEGMSCPEKIRYIIKDKEEVDKDLPVVFPSVFKACQKEKEFSKYIDEIYNSVSTKEKGILLNLLLSNSPLFGKYIFKTIDLALNEEDRKSFSLAFELCIASETYRDKCIAEATKIRSKTNNEGIKHSIDMKLEDIEYIISKGEMLSESYVNDFDD